MTEKKLFVPYARHALVADMHAQKAVLGEEHTESGTSVTVRAPSGWIERWEKQL